MKRIAVIEDNQDNRLLVHSILESEYEVHEYESGIEALESFSNGLPDLVLLDISLPGLDGVQVLRRIRESDTMGLLPVVAFTAHAMAGDREKYLNAGFDAYLSKPITDERTILNTIADCLARKQ